MTQKKYTEQERLVRAARIKPGDAPGASKRPVMDRSEAIHVLAHIARYGDGSATQLGAVTRLLDQMERIQAQTLREEELTSEARVVMLEAVLESVSEAEAKEAYQKVYGAGEASELRPGLGDRETE